MQNFPNKQTNKRINIDGEYVTLITSLCGMANFIIADTTFWAVKIFSTNTTPQTCFDKNVTRILHQEENQNALSFFLGK